MVKLEIELTSEQLQEIKATYNLTEKPKLVCKSRPIPSAGDRYWCISINGIACSDTWNNDGADHMRYAIGNVYYYEEEANFAVEKKLITQELKDFALEHNDGKIDWENSNNKYYICLSYFSRLYYSQAFELNIGVALFYKDGDTIYFTSEEIAQQAVNKIGEERLLKYYFGEWEEINERH